MSSRPTIDVSRLPMHAYGPHTTLWWGNVLMFVIEGTMFAIVIASYFYIRKNFAHWPPLNTPFPDLLPGTVNTAVMLLCCAPVAWVHRLAVNEGGQMQIEIGMALCVLLMIAAAALRWYEFPQMHVTWDNNAYGSITWGILAAHFGHLLAALAEASVLLAWCFTHRLDPKHRLDLSMLALYWYFVVGAWILLYAVIYFGPRLL